MLANCDRHCPLLRRMLIAVSALAVGFSLSAAAQTAPAADNLAGGQNFSSSSLAQAYLSTDAVFGGSSLAEPSGAAAGSPQYGGNRRSSGNYPSYEGRMSHIAFVGGAGFTVPIGNDTHFDPVVLNPSVGFGYNVTLGGGWNFTKRVGALLEYQFNRMSMPSDYLKALSTTSGVSGIGGNINTWSLTANPIIYLPMSLKSGGYVTGGGGFYRKVTNFTQAVPQCSFYYGCVNVGVTVGHFSSNQGGANIGLGLYHKVFGEDSNGKLFVEARYVFVDSPAASKSNSFQGEGTEELIPVTFGVRF